LSHLGADYVVTESWISRGGARDGRQAPRITFIEVVCGPA
jgi:hypothetical protein